MEKASSERFMRYNAAPSWEVQRKASAVIKEPWPAFEAWHVHELGLVGCIGFGCADDLFPKVFLPKRHADPLNACPPLERRFVVGRKQMTKPMARRLAEDGQAVSTVEEDIALRRDCQAVRRIERVKVAILTLREVHVFELKD
jgi:hypothetical protein